MASAAFCDAGVKIGYVDIQKVLLNSYAGKKAKEQLAVKANKYDEEKNSKEKELQKLKAELEKQTMLLSSSARFSKEQNYQQKLKDYQRFLKDAQDNLQAKNDELTNKIVTEIVKIARDYGRKNGYTFVFIKNNGLIYATDNADLTEELLNAFNASRNK
jgi:outer membrane protein